MRAVLDGMPGQLLLQKKKREVSDRSQVVIALLSSVFDTLTFDYLLFFAFSKEGVL